MRSSPGAPRALSAGALACVVVSIASVAFARLGGAKDGSVVAHTTATGGLKIEAKTSDVGVAEAESGTVTVTVPLASLDTGISLRNKHLREKFLETDKYPNAELSVERSALGFPSPGQSVSRSAPGTMKLHGQTRQVTFSYSARRDGADYVVKGSVHIRLGDYGITTPSFLGVTVKPDVDVDVGFTVGDT